MSVQSNTYIMAGVKLPFNHFTEDQRLELDRYEDSAFSGIHHHNGLCMIGDGMDSKYVFIGRVLTKTDDQNGNYGLDAPVDCSLVMTPALHAEVTTLISEQFNFAANVHLWVFTHYR